MNLNPDSWTRLADLARSAPDDSHDITAPTGFSTRVVALAFAGEPAFSVLFARYATRALGICGLLMVLAVSLNLSVAIKTLDNETSSLNDPVVEWLEATS